jgi:hypothetical protein
VLGEDVADDAWLVPVDAAGTEELLLLVEAGGVVVLDWGEDDR